MDDEHVLLPMFVAEGVEIDWTAMQEAKDALVLPFFVRTIRADREEAAGLRVLAVGGSPDWACDSFLIGPGAAQEELMQALEWVLDPEYDDPHATRALDFLRSVLGPGVEEMDPATPMSARFTDDGAAGAPGEEADHG